MSLKIEPHTPAERKILIVSAVLVFLSVALDQASKLLAACNMQLHESIVIVPGWFNFTYVRNPGAAWSMLAGFPWLLLGFGVFAGLLILLFFRRWSEGWPERYIALALIESGIIGNSIDRLWHGSVIDFFHIHYYDYYHYPIFNVADCAICIGVVIFIFSNFFRPNGKGEKTASA